jgi:hypothetical protein
MGLKALVIPVDHRGQVTWIAGAGALRATQRGLRRACRALSRTHEGSAKQGGTPGSACVLVPGSLPWGTHEASFVDSLCLQYLHTGPRRCWSLVVRDGGGRGLERGQDAPSSAAGPKPCRSGLGDSERRADLAERSSGCEVRGPVIDREVGAARSLLTLAVGGRGVSGATGKPGVTGHEAMVSQPLCIPTRNRGESSVRLVAAGQPSKPSSSEVRAERSPDPRQARGKVLTLV